MSETINVPRTLKKQPLAIRVIAGIAKYIFLLILFCENLFRICTISRHIIFVNSFFMKIILFT